MFNGGVKRKKNKIKAMWEATPIERNNGKYDKLINIIKKKAFIIATCYVIKKENSLYTVIDDTYSLQLTICNEVINGSHDKTKLLASNRSFRGF